MTSVSSTQSVFCPLLQGKPDPKQPDDASARVVQPPQKGDTCAFYALKILRNGKGVEQHSLDYQLEERRIKKIISTHRKMITRLNTTLKGHIVFAQCITDFSLKGVCTKSDAGKLSNYLLNTAPQEYRELGRSAIQAFCSQDTYQDFVTFAESNYQQALINAHEWCLKELGIPKDVIQGSLPPQLGKKWQELSLKEKEWYEQNAVFKASAFLCGTTNSDWHPNQPIENLIKQLQLHGPLLIKGSFGQSYYEDKPFELTEKIENRSIFGWKPNAKRNEDNSLTHAIVVVGAKTDKQKSHIYFVDPIDGSDPKDPSVQKTYVMSYDKLRQSICSLDGVQMRKQNEVAFENELKEKNNYALYL